jgi:hypothetical protein
MNTNEFRKICEVSREMDRHYERQFREKLRDASKVI